MGKRLSPECRRIVMAYAASEKMGYFEALEFLVMEGFKSIGEAALWGVDKAVYNIGIKQ